MYCCINCFKDPHICDTIKRLGTIGNCDFCSAKGTYVYNIKETNPISDMIVSLVQVYSISDDDTAKLLKLSLREDWDIFNSGSEGIQTLVMALCSNEANLDKELFEKNVIIPQKYDEDFMNEYGVVKNLTWNEFSDYIKFSNRFHNDYFNGDAFASFLSMAVVSIKTDSCLFRARICHNTDGYETKDMYGPPKGKRTAGRINPEEISVLYLSSNERTVLHEARANVYDFVCIGTFKAKRDLKLVNLSNISKMSPFLYDGEIEQFAVNRNIFKDMVKEISKPLRRNESALEYLPTQFIAEFVKSQKYDGVVYESTLCDSGYNIALFDESLVECISVKTQEITNIEYEFRH